jgi:hypothetical protein
MSQPFGISCRGGLNTNLNQFEMLKNPGLARKLLNFEVDPDGGYRRLQGYQPFGAESATRPNGSNRVWGVFPYALGLVACVGTGIYYSEDGESWTKVNYNTGGSGALQGDLSGLTELDRPDQTQAQFALIKGATNYATNPYGTLTIATGEDKVANFYINGTGASRTFHYTELTIPAAGKYLEHHDKHLCVVDAANEPNTVYYSATNSDRDFQKTGSGSVRLTDVIVGIKSFRNSLFIFCENTIHRLDNINDPATINIVQITNDVGCLSGYSVQEIGGDLVFLAPDGIRTVAGTERIDDVELSSVSRQIQEIISGVARFIDTYVINSAVIRTKSQYRLFYSTANAPYSESRGIIGTLTPNGYEWSETVGIQAHAFVSDYDGLGIERTYHGDKDGYIYVHEIGNSFNPAGVETAINASYTTPFFDFGDVGTRKTLKYIRASLSPEGEVAPFLRVVYDFEDPGVPQPDDYLLENIQFPAIFGAVIFGAATFGATNDPMVRQPVEGSGNTVSVTVFSNTVSASYSVNGLYIDYMPSGRR